MSWTYDPKRREYTNSDTGQVLGAEELLVLRDQFLDTQLPEVEDLARRVAAGDLSPSQWEKESAALILGVFVAEGLLGRGGVNAITDAELSSVAESVSAQMDYLSGFRADVAEGMSEAAIAARAGLYVEAGKQAFEAMRARAFGLERLPEHPADGSQECGANCRCWWELEETASAIRAHWRTDSRAQHCDSCLENASKWNPLVLEKAAAAVG